MTASATHFANHNPATGELIAEVQITTAAAIDAAVERATAAQREWARLTGADRGRVLRRAANLLRARNDELAQLETLDTGKPIQETSVVDVASGADAIEFFAGVAPTIAGEHVDLGPAAFGYTRREPLGVTAGIGAWNYPLQIACWKSAPALACGNAMLFKPSELTPLTAVELEKIYREAGCPEGLFQVVQGMAETGEALCRHAGIAKVSLTGSVPTGRKILAAAAPSIKKVTLELGGKSALIVFADANLDDAVAGAMLANFYSAGQVCSNGTRVFVQRAVQDAFLAGVKARAEAIVLGDPRNPATQMGPLVSAAQAEKVLGFIAQGLAEGARLVTGGTRRSEGALAHGHYIAPTIFADCCDDMVIVREEIFGPVMSVLAFDHEEDVVARANASDYGLAAGVFTNDLTRAHRVVAALDSGTCWVNAYNITPIELPFGGFKQSGMGFENSRAAVEHYSRLKSVYVGMGPVEAPY